MSDPVATCNLALSWLGGNLITSLDDPQQEARLCNAAYNRIRKSLLNTGYFSFAFSREIWSTPLATPPEWGYGVAFKIPSKILKVWSVRRDTTLSQSTQDTLVDFARVGDEIHVDEGVILVELIKDVTNTAEFSDLFEQAFAARIAADIAIPLTQNRSLQKDLYMAYEAKMDEAAGHDNQIQNKRPQKTSRLILARNRSSVGIGRGAAT